MEAIYLVIIFANTDALINEPRPLGLVNETDKRTDKRRASTGGECR